MARVYVMKRRRSAIGIIIGIGVVIVLLALTNPTLFDLESYVKSKASSDARRDAGNGILGDIVSGIASGGAGFVAKNFYMRRSFVIFSTFEPKSSRNPRYLGVLKGIFVKI
jgi:hypothetical protein